MFAKNSLYFMLMNDKYYDEMSNLDEFQEDHHRGHGILIVDISDLLIAIPLRSKLKPYMRKSKHIFPYETYIIKNKTFLKGLDLSKITIIQEHHVDLNKNYLFKDIEEKQFYLNNFNRLKLRVNNYINGYIDVCNKIENKIDVSSPIRKYRYTTLKNFHKELNINITKADFDNTLNKIFK